MGQNAGPNMDEFPSAMLLKDHAEMIVENAYQGLDTKMPLILRADKRRSLSFDCALLRPSSDTCTPGKGPLYCPKPATAINVSAAVAAFNMYFGIMLDAEFDIFIKQLMAQWEVPGMVIGVVQHDKGTRYFKSYGQAYGDTEITPQTRFPICSLTKLFVAITLLRLLDEHKVGLTTPIKTVLPNFQLSNEDNGASVTFQHALNHTTGLESSDVMYTDPAAQADMLGYISTLPCAATPGSLCHYSNYMYDILALAIEALSGRKHTQVLKEDIFEPLGMVNTSFEGVSGKDVSMGLVPKLEGRELQPGQGIQVGWTKEMGLQVLPQQKTYMGLGSYAIVSCAEDMTKWLVSLHSTPFFAIACKAYTKINDPCHLGSSLYDQPLTYGMGLYQGSHAGVGFVETYGAIAGYRSSMAYIPDLDCSVVCHANSDEATGMQVLVRVWMIRKSLGLQMDEVMPKIIEERQQMHMTKTKDFPAIQGLPLPSNLPMGTYTGPGLGKWHLTRDNYTSLRPECANTPYLPWLYGYCTPILTHMGEDEYAGCMRWESKLDGRVCQGCPFWLAVMVDGTLQVTGRTWGQKGELCVLRKEC